MSTSVYLVRHAIAAERGDEWPDDAKRPVTHKGAARMREIVAGLVALEMRVDLVLTSPLVRARQTADMLVDGLGLTPAPLLVIAPALAPEGEIAHVADEIGKHEKRSGIAVVGHEPGLGELAAWLIGAATPLPLKKGGVCRIDLSGRPRSGSAQLIWLATPRMLRALGGG